FNLTGDFFSHEGPLARTVTDAALYLDVCAGPDPRDRFSYSGAPPAFTADLERLPASLRVAWSPDLGFAHVDREYAATCATAVERFASAIGPIDAASPEGAEAGLHAWRLCGAAGNWNEPRAELQRANVEKLTPAVRSTLTALEKVSLTDYFKATLELRA